MNIQNSVTAKVQNTLPGKNVWPYLRAALFSILACTPLIAAADPIPTVDRLGQLQSEIAVLKAEVAAAKARQELATAGGHAGGPAFAAPAKSTDWSTDVAEVPTIKSITGTNRPVALLKLPDGNHVSVREGNQIGNFTVTHISATEVALTDKHKKTLSLGFAK